MEKFGQWTSDPTGKGKAYLSGAYWNGKSKYAIVVCPYTRYFKLKPKYDIYEIPQKFIGKDNMVCNFKNPITKDIDCLKDAIEYVNTLEGNINKNGLNI